MTDDSLQALRTQVRLLAAAAACDAVRDLVKFKRRRLRGDEALELLDSEAKRLAQPALEMIEQLSAKLAG